nr:MAG TPA: hypothetical protein [Caudoviricetes sp.]
MNRDATHYQIKSRLAAVGRTQMQLIAEMEKRGVYIPRPNHFSASLRKRQLTDLEANRLELADKIITEWENEE